MDPAVRPLSARLEDVRFAHWPVDEAAVGDLLPDWLVPDRYDGTAWVSAVFLRLSSVAAFDVPVPTRVRALTFRTYVRTREDEERGIYFLSIDASDRLVVAAVRTLLDLPIHHARIRVDDGARWSVRISRRRADVTVEVTTDPSVDAPGDAVAESASDPRSGSVERGGTTPPPDTIAGFLVERYRMFATGPLGHELTANIGHDPWSIRPSAATIDATDLFTAVGLDPPTESPLVQDSPGIDVSIGPPRPLSLQ